MEAGAGAETRRERPLCPPRASHSATDASAFVWRGARGQQRLIMARVVDIARPPQERARAEPLEIIYSYWDGAGHRRKVTVKKGDTIGQFLRAVRDQLAPEFREMRARLHFASPTAPHLPSPSLAKHSAAFAAVGRRRSDTAPPAPASQMASPDSMLYIKEDLIIPNSLTFYELIINKARGKSGPLFHFDVHEARAGASAAAGAMRPLAGRIHVG